MALTQQPHAHTGKKGFSARNGHRAGREDYFLNPFVHRRTPDPYPTLSAEVKLSQRSLQEVTLQDESFMPAISGYIRERVKCSRF